MDDQPIQGHMLIADWFGQIQMKRDLGRLHLNCRIWALPVRGGLNPCPDGQLRQLWHLKLTQKVPQSARLSAGGGGVQKL